MLKSVCLYFALIFSKPTLQPAPSYLWRTSAMLSARSMPSVASSEAQRVPMSGSRSWQLVIDSDLQERQSRGHDREDAPAVAGHGLLFKTLPRLDVSRLFVSRFVHLETSLLFFYSLSFCRRSRRAQAFLGLVSVSSHLCLCALRTLAPSRSSVSSLLYTSLPSCFRVLLLRHVSGLRLLYDLSSPLSYCSGRSRITPHKRPSTSASSVTFHNLQIKEIRIRQDQRRGRYHG